MYIATAVLTYTEIPRKMGEEVTKNKKNLSPAWALSNINAILEKENHPFIRSNALVAISRLARFNFEEIASRLEALIPTLTDKEQGMIVNLLVQIYLKERKGQTGGEDHFTANGEKYPIWIETERPRIPIETAMYNWSLYAANSAAVQLAYQAESAFRKVLEREEEIFVQKFINDRKLMRNRPKQKEGEPR